MTATTANRRLLVLAAFADNDAAGLATLGVAAEAVARGWTVTVATPDGPLAELVTDAGARHLPVDDVAPLGPGRAAARGAVRRARRVGRRNADTIADADAVVVAGEWMLHAVAASAATGPVFWLARGVPIGPVRRLVVDDVIGVVDMVVAPDEHVARVLIGSAPPVAVVGTGGDAAARTLDVVAARLAATPAIAGAARRAVFAVPDYLPTIGGTTRQTANQARALHDRGWHVDVLTQRIDRRWPQVQRVEGTEVHRLQPASRHRWAMKLVMFRSWVWLRRHRDRIDVVNVVMYPDFAVSAILAGLGDRVVMCWAGLGDATDTLAVPGLGVRHALARARLRLLRGVVNVALTPALVEELARCGIPDRVELVPIPLDTERFRPPTSAERDTARRDLGISPDAFVVAYVGHLRALKRVDRLVTAFARVQADVADAHLVIVGGSRSDLEDETQALRAQVAAAGISDRVTFTGTVPDVEHQLHAADIFVLPSDREGLPNAILEAMACGLACVAPASAGGDQVLDDTTGIIPPSNSADDLTAAIVSLAIDPERSHRLGAAAAVAAGAYGLEAVAARYESIYARLRPAEFRPTP